MFMIILIIGFKQTVFCSLEFLMAREDIILYLGMNIHMLISYTINSIELEVEALADMWK